MGKVIATVESDQYSTPALKALVQAMLAEAILYHNEVKVEVKEE